MLESLFAENKKATKKTVIYYSKTRSMFYLVASILLFGFGVYAFFAFNYFLGIGIIGFSVYEVYTNYLLFKDRSVQLVLSEEGISYRGGRIQKWSGIQNEKVVFEPLSSGQEPDHYLSYDYKSKNQKILINELDISEQRVEYLLKIYRKRSEKNK